MTTAEVEAFLRSGRNLQVATHGADGFPHLTTLWYVLVDGAITFRSFAKSQRIVNLRRDSRLTVLVEDGVSYDTLRGVMVKGKALLSEDRATVLNVYGAVAAKYGGLDTADPDAVEALFGRFADKNTVVTVEPVKVVSWDHTKQEKAG